MAGGLVASSPGSAMPTLCAMDVSLPRPPRALGGLDLGGLANLVLAMWGLAVVVRGSAIAACPGCHSTVGGRDLVVTGTLWLAVAAVVVWGRGCRLAASAIVAPGLVASIALVAAPTVPLHLLGLGLAPWAIAAARAAVRRARPREIGAAIWAFGLSAVAGAAGTGFGSALAAAVVVACALATPNVLAFRLPTVPDTVPEDLT
jgi:hypothetical protein